MRRLPMMLAAATILSGAALIGTAQAAPIAPAGVAPATQQSTDAIQHAGWPGRWGPGPRWHRWGWRGPGWGWRRWHRRPWGWRRW